MPRFVLLDHDHPWPHWDLMLEAGEVLLTWRLSAMPAAGQLLAAQALGGHRLIYLDHEGPVSGGRGRVVRCAAGDFSWLAREPGQLHVRLESKQLRGILTLTRIEGESWSGSFEPEPGADQVRGLG